MEYGSFERQIHIDASPEVVFDVISKPEHVREWWPDEADYPVEPGGEGHIAFGDPTKGDGRSVRFTVVDVSPPRLFSFRWTHAEGETAARGNSYLVVFELEPQGSGTLLRMSETGFRERGWDEAKVALEYADHATGWDYFLGRLPSYAERIGAEV